MTEFVFDQTQHVDATKMWSYGFIFTYNGHRPWAYSSSGQAYARAHEELVRKVRHICTEIDPQRLSWSVSKSNWHVSVHFKDPASAMRFKLAI